MIDLVLIVCAFVFLPALALLLFGGISIGAETIREATEPHNSWIRRIGAILLGSWAVVGLGIFAFAPFDRHGSKAAVAFIIAAGIWAALLWRTRKNEKRVPDGMEEIVLSGGPLDGQVVQVRAGAAVLMFDVASVNPIRELQITQNYSPTCPLQLSAGKRVFKYGGEGRTKTTYA